MYKQDLEKSEEPEVKLPTSIGSWRKQGNSRKISTSADYTIAFDCVDHNKLWKILKGMEIPDHHLTYLQRNLYTGQEAIVKIRHGATNQFKIGKGVHQGSILSPCLLNLYAEYIIWNIGLDESQGGLKIARRNISNIRYADDTT